eukprot:5241106-Amphidinium_carterae.1
MKPMVSNNESQPPMVTKCSLLRVLDQQVSGFTSEESTTLQTCGSCSIQEWKNPGITKPQAILDQRIQPDLHQ